MNIVNDKIYNDLIKDLPASIKELLNLAIKTYTDNIIFNNCDVLVSKEEYLLICDKKNIKSNLNEDFKTLYKLNFNYNNINTRFLQSYSIQKDFIYIEFSCNFIKYLIGID